MKLFDSVKKVDGNGLCITAITADAMIVTAVARTPEKQCGRCWNQQETDGKFCAQLVASFYEPSKPSKQSLVARELWHDRAHRLVERP